MYIIVSISDFIFHFSLLTLSLNFWGRNILKLFKVSEGPKPNTMLRIVAALALMLFLAQALFPFVEDFSIFLLAFFAAGLIGAVLNFAFYWDILYKNSIVISDILYDKIFNASRPPATFSPGEFFVYDLPILQSKGYAAIHSGTFHFDWTLKEYPIHYKFMVPSDLTGRNVDFSINLIPLATDLETHNTLCSKIDIGFYTDPNTIVWAQRDFTDASVPIPAKTQKMGYYKLSLKLALKIGLTGINQS
jgi:hypothetical protein